MTNAWGEVAAGLGAMAVAAALAAGIGTCTAIRPYTELRTFNSERATIFRGRSNSEESEIEALTHEARQMKDDIQTLVEQQEADHNE